MQNEILVTKREDKLLTIRTEGKRIVQIDAEDIEEESVLGNIYVGKVRNVVKNINAAFVELFDGQMAFLPLDDEWVRQKAMKVLEIHDRIKKKPVKKQNTLKLF